MKLLCSMLFLIFSPLIYASIYVQVDSNGHTTYSDVPLSQGAKPLSLPNKKSVNSITQAPSIPSITSPSPTTISNTQEKERNPYSTFMIVSPKNGESIANQPNVTVTVKIEPELLSGDTIQAYLDGSPVSAPATTTHIPLGLIERGTHTLSVKLFDRNQQLLKASDTITIYVQRSGLNSPARQGSAT
jgi:hypothetical protein